MTTTVQDSVQTLTPPARPNKVEAGVKLRGAEKVARIPVKIIPTEELPRKPDWIRVRIPVTPEVERIKQLLRKHKLHSVCEEASCPNLGECFSGGTATFMIMGDICTRRCPFCDVGHGRPKPLDVDEPHNLAVAIADLMMTLPSRDLRLLTEGELKAYGLDGVNAVQEDLERIRLLRKCGEAFVRRKEGFTREFDAKCTRPGQQVGAMNACGRKLRAQFGFPDAHCADENPMAEIDPALQ